MNDAAEIAPLKVPVVADNAPVVTAPENDPVVADKVPPIKFPLNDVPDTVLEKTALVPVIAPVVSDVKVPTDVICV